VYLSETKVVFYWGGNMTIFKKTFILLVSEIFQLVFLFQNGTTSLRVGVESRI